MNRYTLTINPRSRWSERAIMTKVSIRELEILISHSEGKDNEEIAEELDIKYQTVKNMLYAITKKLGAKNNAQALMKAISENLIRVSMPETGDIADKIMRVVESESAKPDEVDEFIINGIRKLFRRGKKKDE